MLQSYLFLFLDSEQEQKILQTVNESNGAIRIVHSHTAISKEFAQLASEIKQAIKKDELEHKNRLNQIFKEQQEAKMELLSIQKKMKESRDQLNDYRSELNILKSQVEANTVILEKIKAGGCVEYSTGFEIKFREEIEPWQRIVMMDLIKHCIKIKDKYEEETLELARIIHTYSPAALEAARKYIPLPCKNTLANHFHEEETLMEKSLLNCSCAVEILSNMHYPMKPDQQFENIITDQQGIPMSPKWVDNKNQKIYEIMQTNEQPRIAIALDAISLKLWSTVSDDAGDKNDLFIFYAMPLNFEAQNVAIHCIPHKNGSAGPEIQGKLDQLLDTLRDHIKVSYVITDGDPGYDQRQDVFFNVWFKPDIGLDEMKERAKNFIQSQITFIRDIVHLAKNFRAWLINPLKTIVTSPFNKCQTVEPSDIEDLIKLGDALNDISNIGKMKDRYAITLFSMQVLKKCIEKRKFSPFLFLFPLTFLFEAIRNEHFDQQTRLIMLTMALEVVIQLLRNIDLLGLGNTLPADEEDPNKAYYFATPRHLQSLASAIMVFIIELEKNPRLNFSHLTTLSEEHFNGLVRTMCRFKHDYNSTMRVIAKVNCLVAIKNDRKFPKHPERRGDSAGTTMDPEKHITTIVPEKHPSFLVNCILSLCENEPQFHDPSYNEEGWSKFCEYFEALFKHRTPIKISRALSSQLQGTMIMARLAQKKPDDAYIEAAEQENQSSIDQQEPNPSPVPGFYLTSEQLSSILHDHVQEYLQSHDL